MSATITDKDIYELIRMAKNGDKTARDHIVENNIGLVWSVARKFYGRGHEPDDLFQIGSIGLLKAINKFDDSFGVKFSTYAVPMIMGEIKRFIRDDGIIKVSRSLKETAGRAAVARDTLTKELLREPSVEEIAGKLEISTEDLLMALDANNAPNSLHYENSDNSNLKLIDQINEGHDVELSVINRVALQNSLRNFKARERQIIVLRYFAEKTQTQIAQMLGISQVQVSRIEKKVLEEMRKMLSTS